MEDIAEMNRFKLHGSNYSVKGILGLTAAAAAAAAANESSRDDENKKFSQRSTTPVDHNREHEMDEEGGVVSDELDREQ